MGIKYIKKVLNKRKIMQIRDNIKKRLYKKKIYVE